MQRYNLYRLTSKGDSLYVFPPFDPIHTHLEHNLRYFHLLERKEEGWLLKITLYSNQINARALIGQSAMVYCARKLCGKIVRLLNYYIKATDHKFLRATG